MERHLLPGFRFYPTEEELISFYLHHMLLPQPPAPALHKAIPLLHIYELEPWHLPELSGELCRGDSEQWFFFTPLQEREARGGRPSRTTRCGYWKATGSPGSVYSSDGRAIGVKKTMVFYRGRAPAGRKTKWKMNEYRAITQEAVASVPKLMHEFSLCRVYVVSGTFQAFDRRPVAAAAAAAASGEMKLPPLFSETAGVELTSSVFHWAQNELSSQREILNPIECFLDREHPDPQ